MKLGVEVMPERPADIGKSVDAEAVGTGLLEPPNRVLDEVAADVRGFLIEIGELVHEPAFGDIALVAPG